MDPLPIFLDFEASSLRSASYPIEVAWNRPYRTIDTYLISPAGIPRWTDWSGEAERFHGISRALLLTRGKPPSWICRRLNHHLAGTVVYSDEPAYDRAWLTEVFAASVSGSPTFPIHHAYDLLMRLIGPRFSGRIQAQPPPVDHHLFSTPWGSLRNGTMLGSLPSQYACYGTPIMHGVSQCYGSLSLRVPCPKGFSPRRELIRMPPDAVLTTSSPCPGQLREYMSGVWHIFCSLPGVVTCVGHV
jgi:hypothetical protein